MKNKKKSVVECFTLYEVILLVNKMLDYEEVFVDLADEGEDYVSFYRFYKSKERNPLKDKCLGRLKYIVVSTNTDVEKDLNRQQFRIEWVKDGFKVHKVIENTKQMGFLKHWVIRARRYKLEKDELEEEKDNE